MFTSTIIKNFNFIDSITKGELDFLQLPNWHGLEKVGFIYHNTWADPEIEYNGKIYNVHIISDCAWEMYCEEAYENGENANDAAYELWLQDNADFIYEELDRLSEYGDGKQRIM